jgi:flagellar hook assembly protein FlgD
VLLAPNTPNPFSDRTTLRFHLSVAGTVTLNIADASGRLVRSLARESFPAGWNQIQWDGRSSSGQKVAPGVYFSILDAEGQTRSRRLIVAR